MQALFRAAPILIVMTALAVLSYAGSQLPASAGAPDQEPPVVSLFSEAEAWQQHRRDGNYPLMWARYADLETRTQCTFADFVAAEEDAANGRDWRLSYALSDYAGRMAFTEHKPEDIYQDGVDLPLAMERRSWSLDSGRWETATECGA